jgi:hypothetical protein
MGTGDDNAHRGVWRITTVDIGNRRLTAAAAQVVSQSGPVPSEQANDLTTEGMTAISAVMLTQNHDLTVQDRSCWSNWSQHNS